MVPTCKHIWQVNAVYDFLQQNHNCGFWLHYDNIKLEMGHSHISSWEILHSGWAGDIVPAFVPLRELKEHGKHTFFLPSSSSSFPPLPSLATPSSFLALLRPPAPTGQFSSVLFLVSNSFLPYCWRLACSWRFPGQLQFPDALAESQLSTGQLKEIALVCAVQAP